MVNRESQTGILSIEEGRALMLILEERFRQHPHRHGGVSWSEVLSRLDSRAEKLWSLNKMEQTGGEPDVTGRDEASGQVMFMDCSAESPRGRRSLCYDPEALESRREHKPADSAWGMATSMGIEVLSEAQYRDLQKLGEFDTRTSSWIKTPMEIRRLGGALFADRRYGQIFVYHNGAESYYGARGFRGLLMV